jgi:hypothetical protein
LDIEDDADDVDMKEIKEDIDVQNVIHEWRQSIYSLIEK